MFGVEEHQWPAQGSDLNFIQPLLNELEHQLRDRPSPYISVGPNSLLAEWEEIFI